MSQNDFNIANQGFPATRADINSALQALASNSAGTAEPSTTYAYQFWYDETNELLKMRNSDNDAWITIGTFDQVADTFTPAGVTTDKIEEGNSSVEVVDTGTGYVAITVDGVEAARVDTSGNLLVGTTSTTPAVSNDSDGIALQANGTVQFSANATTTAIINRKATDGSILQFRKDGGTVGSIGSVSGVVPYFSSSQAGGIRFSFSNSTEAVLIPCTTTGANADASHNIGSATERWKDLYLSGGVYLGGTGAANYLDDVETGTFTPTVFGATTAGTTVYGQQQGFYEKVGNVVNVMIGLSITSMSGTGSIKIGGLPFAAKNAAGYEANGSVMYTSFNIGSYTQLSPYIPYNTAVMDLFISTSNQPWVLAQAQGGWAMRITITYQV